MPPKNMVVFIQKKKVFQRRYKRTTLGAGVRHLRTITNRGGQFDDRQLPFRMVCLPPFWIPVDTMTEVLLKSRISNRKAKLSGLEARRRRRAYKMAMFRNFINIPFADSPNFEVGGLFWISDGANSATMKQRIYQFGMNELKVQRSPFVVLLFDVQWNPAFVLYFGILFTIFKLCDLFKPVSRANFGFFRYTLQCENRNLSVNELFF